MSIGDFNLSEIQKDVAILMYEILASVELFSNSLPYYYYVAPKISAYSKAT